MSNKRVTVIVDGVKMEVEPFVADMFRRMGEAQEKKIRELVKAMSDLLTENGL